MSPSPAWLRGEGLRAAVLVRVWLGDPVLPPSVGSPGDRGLRRAGSLKSMLSGVLMRGTSTPLGTTAGPLEEAAWSAKRPGRTQWPGQSNVDKRHTQCHHRRRRAISHWLRRVVRAAPGTEHRTSSTIPDSLLGAGTQQRQNHLGHAPAVVRSRLPYLGTQCHPRLTRYPAGQRTLCQRRARP